MTLMAMFRSARARTARYCYRRFDRSLRPERIPPVEHLCLTSAHYDGIVLENTGTGVCLDKEPSSCWGVASDQLSDQQDRQPEAILHGEDAFNGFSTSSLNGMHTARPGMIERAVLAKVARKSCISSDRTWDYILFPLGWTGRASPYKETRRHATVFD